MTAKGKINASKVQVGDRIIVRPMDSNLEHRDTIRPSDTKTGEGVEIVRVLAKTFRAASAYERQGKYVIMTSAGPIHAAGSSTMWLAPEDTAGIKRAHAEAIELDKVYEAYPLAEIDLDTLPDPDGANDLPVPSEFFEQAQDELTEDRAVEQIRQAAEAPNRVETVQSASSPVTGSTVVSLLERVWDRIREDHPELPVVVITTGSGEGTKWGHFRADSWKIREEGAVSDRHELLIASEALAKGAHQVLQTMLHEAAHTLAKVREIKDTSRQGRWHNRNFHKMAWEMGLEHKGAQADSSHGFAFVTLTAATKERYADLLTELDREIRLTGKLPVWLGGSTDEEDAEGGERMTKPRGGNEGAQQHSGSLKAVCNCEQPNIIRLSRKVLDLAVVRCDSCEGLFTAAS